MFAPSTQRARGCSVRAHRGASASVGPCSLCRRKAGFRVSRRKEGPWAAPLPAMQTLLLLLPTRGGHWVGLIYESLVLLFAIQQQ